MISLDQVPLAIYAKDLQGRFLYANTLALEIWGVSLQEILGKTDKELWVDFGADNAPKYMEDDQTVIKTGKPLLKIHEPAVKNRGSSVLPSVGNKSPLRDAQGNIIGVIGVFTFLKR